MRSCKLILLETYTLICMTNLFAVMKILFFSFFLLVLQAAEVLSILTAFPFLNEKFDDLRSDVSQRHNR